MKAYFRISVCAIESKCHVGDTSILPLIIDVRIVIRRNSNSLAMKYYFHSVTSKSRHTVVDRTISKRTRWIKLFLDEPIPRAPHLKCHPLAKYINSARSRFLIKSCLLFYKLANLFLVVGNFLALEGELVEPRTYCWEVSASSFWNIKRKKLRRLSFEHFDRGRVKTLKVSFKTVVLPKLISCIFEFYSRLSLRE